MPSVQLPDGTEIEFPEGTSQEVINRVSKEHWQKSTQERPDLLTRFGGNILEGAAAIPGLPIEAGALLGNLASSLTGGEWRNVESDPNIGQWGARGWQGFFDRNVIPLPSISKTLPKPEGDIERLADKAGQFVGSGVVFGPSAIIPTATSFVGSEVGRAADQLGLTGGYGEPIGAVIGGTMPGITKGIKTSGFDASTAKVNVERAAKSAYRRAENAGVIVNEQPLQRLSADINGELTQFGYLPKLHPRVGAALEEIDRLSQGNTTLKGLDLMRRVARNVGNSLDDSEKSISTMMVKKIDDMIDNLHPTDVVAGNAQMGAAALKEARKHWHKLSKAEIIDEAVKNAEMQTGSTWSGGNINNAIRQNIKQVLKDRKKSKFFSKEERDLMKRIVTGTTTQNALRLLGKLSPEGSGVMLLSGLGSVASFGVGGAAPFAVSAGAKSLADALTRRNVGRLSETILTKGNAPLTKTQKINAVLLELKRRAELARKSAMPGVAASLAYQGPPQ